MRFRKLRTAWSAVFGTLGLLLIALSTRSFERCDAISKLTSSGEVAFGSNDCTLYTTRVRLFLPATIKLHGWTHSSSKATATIKQFQLDLKPGRELISLPNWLLLIVCTAATAAPWLGRRFSLRTLLIATTLVAMVLGLAVYAAGK